MGFLSHRGPAVTAGFLSTLDKLGQTIDPKVLHERLRVGAGPWWGAGGVAAGLAIGSRAAREMGPRAFWPTALLAAATGLGGAKLLQRAYEGSNREEERLLEAIRASRLPAALPKGRLLSATKARVSTT